ncbi:MAG TPA: NBR1-Ig-like domain-containing protein [Anaerolineaceae bacterium]
MGSIKNAARKLLIILGAIVLTACGSVSTPAPTQDVSAIKTEVAKTVVAEVKATLVQPTVAQAAVQPTNTPVPPTATKPAPTATNTALPVIPTAVPTLAPTTTPTPTVVVVYKAPTATRASSDVAQYIRSTPLDFSYLGAGTDFDVRWTVKNVGSKAWNNKYYYKFVSGDKMHKKDIYYLGETVNLGSTVDLVVDMVAPLTAGQYSSNWAFVSDNGEIMLNLWIKINVK